MAGQTPELLFPKLDGRRHVVLLLGLIWVHEGRSLLRKTEALEAVSSGPARLFFTPNDVNLTIESKEQ